MTTMPVLQYDHVARSFQPGKPVLRDVSLTLHAGEVVALLGRNGAGKTTLIHLAMGMLAPQAGTVRVFGLDPIREPVAVKRRVGHVAEDQAFPGDMRVPELLTFHRRVFPTWDAALERDLLDRFGLAGNRSRIATLSKGQARQVALVCAICHRPELLILDEPAGGLDAVARRTMIEAAMELLAGGGTTILFSSHHLTDVTQLGGRAVLLDDGRVALDESLDALREEHCVAVLARDAVASAATIARVSGCLQVRELRGRWHAVFRGTPAVTQRRLARELGIDDVICRSVSLGDLFVELLGDERPAGTRERDERAAGVP